MRLNRDTDGVEKCRFARGFAAGCWLMAAVLFLAAAGAAAQQSAEMSAKAIAWANQNIGLYRQAHSFAAQRGQQPQVPVPPMVDPPCHLCGDSSQTQGETQVAAWVRKSEEPEATYIKALLTMDKTIQSFGGPGSPKLTPAARNALLQFEDDAGFINDAGTIAAELVNEKAIPMAKKYNKEPRQAYAGISFLLAANKDEILLGKDQNGSIEAESMAMAQQWVSSIADRIDADVTTGHKYNLCPVYLGIFRDVMNLGGADPQDMDKFQRMLKKLQDLVKFNVEMNLQVMVDGDDGTHLHALWDGKAKLKLNLDLDKSCYTPVFDNGAQMAVDVANWDTITKDSDGNLIPVQLTSARSYNATLGTPQLNVCDPQPIFQIPLSNLNVPQEEITVDGQTSKSAFLVSFMAAVVGANEINSSETNAMTGQDPSLPGGSTNSQQDSGGSGSPSLDATKATIEAHKDDANWLMSSAGQAAIAKLQQEALSMAQSKIAAAGVVVPNVSNLAQLSQSMASAHLPWTNGQAEPVIKALHVTKDNTDITLTIIVRQAAQ